ncbi:MAG: exopolysaccharide biosynthesis protein [Tenericutes bacterium HGW-Tenericutes-6]|jgi:exopolysaccharide biosynthesis protein|nr:MAG: exopolysaccharide biosynthesis protein [Tenericutes bacterium HGW-Tenericutes-6]
MTFHVFKKVYYIFFFILCVTVLLLGFVIPHGGIYVVEPSDPELPSNEPLFYPETLSGAFLNATLIDEHMSDHVIIKLYQLRMFESDIYVADIVVRDPRFIMSGLAKNLFGGQNQVETVSKMAMDRNAVFAINADYASHYNTGIVIKNGEILRRTISYRYATALFLDGRVESFKETQTNAQRLLFDGAWQVFSFGPVLVKNGETVSSVDDGYQRNRVDNPRSAFGWIEDMRYVFVTVDGRSSISIGVDIEELAIIMQSLGAKEAYNFDGGGSATMYFNGRVVNKPSQGYERGVGDMVYIRG